MAGTVAIINPSSGRWTRDEKLDLLKQAGDPLPVVAETGRDNSPDAWLATVQEHRPDRVIVGGGDGTVRHVLDHLHRAGLRIPVAHLPLGTANLAAASLGMPADPREALDQILTGRSMSFDLGQIDRESCFLLAAGVGLPAEIIDGASREKKDQGGFLAYLSAAMKHLDSVEDPPRMRVIPRGAPPADLETSVLLVANLLRFGDLGIDVGHSIDPHDGRLTVAAATSSHLLEMAWIAVQVAAGRERQSRNVWIKDFEELEITFDRPCRVQADGDDLGDRDRVHFRTLPGAAELVVGDEYEAGTTKGD